MSEKLSGLQPDEIILLICSLQGIFSQLMFYSVHLLSKQRHCERLNHKKSNVKKDAIIAKGINAKELFMKTLSKGETGE